MKRLTQKAGTVAARSRPAAAWCLAAVLLAPSLLAMAQEAGFDASGYELRLGAQAARQKKAEAETRAARAAFLPKVEIGGDWVLGGSIGYHPQSVVDADPDSYPTREPSTVGVEASLRLFDGGKRLNVLRAVAAMEAAGRDAALDLRQRLYLESATAALAVVRDRTVLAKRREAAARQRRTLQITRQMLVEESVTRTDIALAAGEVEKAEAEVEGAAGTLEASEIAFAALIGRPPAPRLSQMVPTARLPRSAEEAVVRAQAGAPGPRAAGRFATAAEFAVDAARSSYAPTIDIVGRASIGFDPSPVIRQVDSYTALLRLKMPLFDPTIRPAIDGAAADAEQRRYEAGNARLEAATAARIGFAGRSAALAEGAALERRIARARDAVRGMRIEQDLGIRTVNDVIEAQASLAEAETLAALLAYERDRTAFALLAAIGELDESDVPSPGPGKHAGAAF